IPYRIRKCNPFFKKIFQSFSPPSAKRLRGTSKCGAEHESAIGRARFNDRRFVGVVTYGRNGGR
ncbi:MAG: hypothetical protein IJT70_00250, partial [Clostridia bacterium]|nr:hypothetical protein [Clostridia bacterium]